MGALTRKTIHVRSKRGKLYSRSVLVKSEKPRGSLNWRMTKMGLVSGFLGGVGAYHAGKRAHEHGHAIPGMIAGSVVGSAVGHVAGLAFAYRRDNKPSINWTHGNDR